MIGKFLRLSLLLFYASLCLLPTVAQATASVSEKIFFTSTVHDTLGDFFLVNSDGTGLKRLSNGLLATATDNLIKTSGITYDPSRMQKGFVYAGESFSPDNRYMAVAWQVYIANLDDPDAQYLGYGHIAEQNWLYIIDSKDWQIHSISIGAFPKLFWGISWLFTGDKLAFSTLKNGISEVDIVDVADSFAVEPYLHSDRNIFTPAWSPDGKWVVYVIDDDSSNYEVILANADGTSPQPITSNLGKIPFISSYRDWSPDSSAFLVSSYNDTVNDASQTIYLVHADSGKVEIPVPTGNTNGGFWLNNQTIIMFNRISDTFTQLYLASAEGSPITRLTRTDATVYFLAVSHDQTHIMFTSLANRIYIINADGTGQNVVKFGGAYADYWDVDLLAQPKF